MKKNKKGKLDILFEDKHLLIVNKKGGLPTIKSDNYKDNLYSQVFDYLHKKNQRVFVVHRLDKDTSGIVVFAKSEKVKNILQDNWDNVVRNYIAVVHGKTKEKDTIVSYIKETKTLLSYSTNDKTGKYAKTTYEKIMENKQYTLLKINIQTGRKNQIRLHMQDNKTPILGDFSDMNNVHSKKIEKDLFDEYVKRFKRKEGILLKRVLYGIVARK